MKEIIIVILFIIWYTASLIISETIGKKRKPGREWSFFYCMILSPVLGLIITLLSKDKTKKASSG